MAEVTETESLIYVMPEALANKIAAGEVVQRPASAAKELIENALDAGAGQVTLILKGAGSELIQVVDDGCGMSRQDAVLCFRRHATSKLRAIEDLERILTLGFRGEALASIGAVAQVELRTKRREDASGFCVRIEGGTALAAEPCATANGTSIAVRNLFYNVPARRNFLKSPATEFKHLVETFQVLALSNPRVAFVLVHDDNEVYRLAPAQGPTDAEALAQRVQDLFGKASGDLVAVEETTSYLSAWGLVGRPEHHRRTRGEQFLFVNGRVVQNRYLEHAVTTGYGDLLPGGTYPFFSLFLELSPRHVDVNVHPAKAEVKFDDERGVYGFLNAVVRKALGTADLAPQLRLGAEAPPAALPRPATAWRDVEARRSQGPAFGSPLAFEAPRPTSRLAPGEQSERLYAPAPEHPLPPSDADAPPTPLTVQQVIAAGVEIGETPRLEEETPLWQLHNRYIVTQIRSGLLLVDQNAAQERVLYERFVRCLQDGLGLTQQLLFPQVLEFSPGDHALLQELAPDLKALGFELEFVSGRSVIVVGVPSDISAGGERGILEDVLQQFKSLRDRLQIRGRDALARTMARRSAVQPGQRMSLYDMRTLIDKLFQCEMPYVCPQGRPTMIKVTIEELDKRFGR